METIIILSFVIGFVFALVIAGYGVRFGLSDVPNLRSAHSRTTPRSGGIGIPISVLLTAFIWTDPSWQYPAGPFLFAVLAFILSVFSLVDDLRGLSVKLRFITQFVLAIVIIWVYKGQFLQHVHQQWGLLFAIGVAIILIVYITATTNFFNFMDGINGNTGFMSIISFGLLGVYAIYFKEAPIMVIICYAVFFSTLGFLPVNFPKARVFMGDVGSIFLGFLFASVVVWQATDIKEFLLLLSFQGTLYIDCISTIFLRLFRRENIFEAHNKHLYQRFVHQFKWSHTRATLLFSLFQLLMGIAALWLYNYSFIHLVLLWVVLILFYWFIRFRFKLT